VSRRVPPASMRAAAARRGARAPRPPERVAESPRGFAWCPGAQRLISPRHRAGCWSPRPGEVLGRGCAGCWSWFDATAGLSSRRRWRSTVRCEVDHSLGPWGGACAWRGRVGASSTPTRGPGCRGTELRRPSSTAARPPLLSFGSRPHRQPGTDLLAGPGAAAGQAALPERASSWRATGGRVERPSRPGATPSSGAGERAGAPRPGSVDRSRPAAPVGPALAGAA
jgi:hypothetical protein